MLLTAQDAFALRCAISLQPLPEGMKTSPLVTSLLATLNWKENVEHRLILQDLVLKQPELFNQVMPVDPRSAPPAEAPAPSPSSRLNDELYVPELAKSAQLDEKLVAASEGVGRFQRDCADWLKRKAPMTPHLFLESAPLWAVGLAIAKRCVLRLNFDDIYPNLYMLWIAPTTYYHKSTGLKAITELVTGAFRYLLLPETTTPEMLMAKLAGERPANYEKLPPGEKKLEDAATRFAGQRGMIVDEASKILIPKKYMEGHSELLMQLFDAPNRIERELRGDGKMIIYNPALSLIGATTPAMLSRYLSNADWESGLMARFITITPTERVVKYVPVTDSPDVHAEMQTLRKRLQRIHNAFPVPPERDALFKAEDVDTATTAFRPIEAEFEPGVLDRFNAYAEAMHEMTNPEHGLDERLCGNYGRLPTLTAKLALILTVMDWAEDGANGKPIITHAHWAKAQIFSEVYRKSAHRLLAQLDVGQDVKYEQKILDFITRAQGDKPPTKREIHRGTGIKNRRDVHAAIDALKEAGEIMEVERRSSGAGRPTTGFIIAKGN